MNREKKLFKNTLIVGIGQISTKFITFFMLPLYTYFLSTEEYGIVDLLNTFVSLLIPIIFLQLEQGLFRFLIDSREDENEKKKLISTSLITIVIQSLFYICLFLIFGLFINNEYKYFLLFNVIASMFSITFLQICRGVGDNTAYSIGSVIAGIGTVLFNILFLVGFHMGAYGMLLASLISNISTVLYIFFYKKIYKYIGFKNYDGKLLKKLYKYSVPLVPNQLSWWIVNVSDRTIITFFLGIGINGIYSAVNKFSTICITVFNIFNLTWTESASLHVKDKDSSMFFSKIINNTIKLFSGLAFLIIIIMPFIFKYLIIGEGYQSGYYQVPMLMIATIFTIIVSMYGSIYVALKKSKEIALTSIYAAIINILINILLINKIGLYAASISTLVSYLSMSVYRYFDIQKHIKIDLDMRMIIVSFLLGMFVVGTYYLNNIYLIITALAFTIIYNLYYSKGILVGILNTMLKNRNK